jgi:hypothetical protein
MSHASVCPECAAGKHVNCTGWALDEEDNEVACGCDCQALPGGKVRRTCQRKGHRWPRPGSGWFLQPPPLPIEFCTRLWCESYRIAPWVSAPMRDALKAAAAGRLKPPYQSFDRYPVGGVGQVDYRISHPKNAKEKKHGR